MRHVEHREVDKHEILFECQHQHRVDRKRRGIHTEQLTPTQANVLIGYSAKQLSFKPFKR